MEKDEPDETFLPAYFLIGKVGGMVEVLEVVLSTYCIAHNVAKYKTGEVDAVEVEDPSMIDEFLVGLTELSQSLSQRTEAFIQRLLVDAFKTHSKCLVGLVTELAKIAGSGFDGVVMAAKALMNPIDSALSA